MKKHLFSLLCVLAVALAFLLTAQTMSLSMRVGAEDEQQSPATTKKYQQEEPYVEPSSSSTTTTQPPMPTSSSTTKEPDETTTKQPDPSTDPVPTDPTKPTSPTSEKPDQPHSENPSEGETNKTNTDPSKKPDGSKTTSQKYTTTKRYVPHMTVPSVANTTVEGTTLDPNAAYFERISGYTLTVSAVFETDTTQAQESQDNAHQQLPTIAIVAICLGGIALVTVGLTAGFAIRNRSASDSEDVAADYEQNAYGDDGTYDTQPEAQQESRPQVDEGDTFTVVSLDDKDYMD